MSVVVTGRYVGQKKVELIHEPSGSLLVTEAPRDNGGEGKSFSPTDLLGTALGSCVMTTIAIVAERNGLSVDGMRMHVEKHMGTEPRQVAELPLMVHLPASLSSADRQKLEHAGLACPVHRSLNQQIKMPITFVYDVEP